MEDTPYGPGKMIVRFLAIALLFAQASAQVPMPKMISNSRSELKGGDSRYLPQLAAFKSALGNLGVQAEAEGLTWPVFLKGGLPAGVSYQINSSSAGIEVTANSAEGAAQAASTLIQMVSIKEGAAHWPEMTIEDGPDHQYRSFMIDMGRNPHSPQTIHQVVDMMWMCKANYLHLHLTDDQLFSWPSRAFPKLYSEQAGWTWDDFVALENYSQARGVTIIPEIEVPGHSSLFRNHYPEVFGKTPSELAILPEAQKGVETLIKEVLSVFKASPYFHMGGDEAYGVPQEIQRAFINRLNAFVKSQGRQMLVWEGPHLGKGENKVDTDVIHLIWRNIEMPAQSALDAGYSIVNAPWDPLYIVDHYPRTMFTAVDVDRCYHWNPTRWADIDEGMPTFKNPHITKDTKGILGFCMPWWEGREENLMPLCLPRLAAVSAAAWNREGESDFVSFQTRQTKVVALLQKLSGIELPKLPVADPASQKDNLAFLAKVTPSSGATQPHFGPQRLTNGLTDRFDHFLGFPTQPKPLEIVIDLQKPSMIDRIVIFEAAVGESYEIYDLLVSADGTNFTQAGHSEKGTRGDKNFVEHHFDPTLVHSIKINTSGCHGLTFPSFSRLCEVQAFERNHE